MAFSKHGDKDNDKIMMVLIMIKIMTPNITRSSSDGLRRQKNIRRLMSERAEKKQQKNVAFSKHSDKDNDGINNDKDNDIADIMVKKIMKNIMIVLIMIKIMTQLISRAHCHCISRRKKQQRKVAF